jgi:hypothetical protein
VNISKIIVGQYNIGFLKEYAMSGEKGTSYGMIGFLISNYCIMKVKFNGEWLEIRFIRVDGMHFDIDPIYCDHEKHIEDVEINGRHLGKEVNFPTNAAGVETDNQLADAGKTIDWEQRIWEAVLIKSRGLACDIDTAKRLVEDNRKGMNL